MHKVVVSAVLLITLAAPASLAAQTVGQNTADTRMSEFGETKPPIGYVQFCETHEGHCGPFPQGAARVHLTQSTWRQLVEVNDHVNTAVEPATDWELFGVEEWWTFPLDNRGDCEAYVLKKRKLLMEKGWPANALLITVVRDDNGDGHAILTVTTSAGDFILDNLNPEVRLWRDTEYSYLMRQSDRNPNQWVSLHQDRRQPQLPVAGVDNR